MGEKFNMVSFEEYYIAVYGLKQVSFNLISLVQVYHVRCHSVSCVVLLETQSSMCQITSKFRATLLEGKGFFFFLWTFKHFMAILHLPTFLGGWGVVFV